MLLELHKSITSLALIVGMEPMLLVEMGLYDGIRIESDKSITSIGAINVDLIGDAFNLCTINLSRFKDNFSATSSPIDVKKYLFGFPCASINPLTSNDFKVVLIVDTEYFWLLLPIACFSNRVSVYSLQS